MFRAALATINKTAYENIFLPINQYPFDDSFFFLQAYIIAKIVSSNTITVRYFKNSQSLKIYFSNSENSVEIGTDSRAGIQKL